MATIKELRESNRKRSERHREKQKASGKRSLNVMISSEAYNRLKRRKGSTGETFAQIVEQAIMESAIKRTPKKKEKPTG